MDSRLRGSDRKPGFILYVLCVTKSSPEAAMLIALGRIEPAEIFELELSVPLITRKESHRA